MKILALHGFLGQGSDWDQLRMSVSDTEWITPSIFHPDVNMQLSDFDVAVDTFLEQLPTSGVDLLIGYSFGGRLALEILHRHPGFANCALLLSTHLGGLSPQAAKEKAARDSSWAQRFLSGDWQHNLKEWNQQDLFANDLVIQRPEGDFDKRKLYMALANLSLESQSFFLNLQPDVRGRLVFAVGESDPRYRELYANYKASDWLSDFRVLPGGHRLHLPPSKALSGLVTELCSSSCE